MESKFNFQIDEADLTKISPKTALNINIGVLGHVDSGKTSLARALSKVTSTASLDKNPQSQERGITLDLGFSAFFTKVPEDSPKYKEVKSKYDFIQFTLVDCPGHASLIKTIIGGASIIDIMFLVIDINKGIQTQTAECLVIGELLMQKMIVILNKIDMIEEDKRTQLVEKKMESLRKVFAKTKFGANVPMIPISANIGADEKSHQHLNIDLLIQSLLDNLEIPQRNTKGVFHYLIDHCFPIKGQGSVVTGTVIQGEVKVGDDVYFPQINETKKIKSIQMFKKPVDRIIQGDRAGMLFTQLDNTKIERGIACTPGGVRTVNYCIVPMNRISYCKFEINSKSKFHLTSGHQTVMGQLKIFYGRYDEKEYGTIQDSIRQLVGSGNFTERAQKSQGSVFNFDKEYEYLDVWDQENARLREKGVQVFALIEFEKPMLLNLNSLLIGSKFDTDITQNQCRLGFYGQVLAILEEPDLRQAKKLKIIRHKSKRGTIEKVVDSYTLLVKDLFQKETNISKLVGREITISLTGNTGKIQSSFGNSGKVKVVFDKGVLHQPPHHPQLQPLKFDGELTEEILKNKEVQMNYKKYLFFNN